VSIERTAAGTYKVRWRDVTGKHPSKTVRTEALAIKLERRMMAKTDEGLPTIVRASRHTVRTWSAAWLATAHNLRQGARSLYQRDLDRHILPHLGDIPLARLRPEDIDNFLAGREKAGHAPASLHRYYRTLRRMLNVAVQRDELLRSPLAKVAAPRVPAKEMRFLDADHLEALAAAAYTRTTAGAPLVSYRAMVLVAGWGGLRWSELAGLRPTAISSGGVLVARQLIDGRRWEEPKGNGARFVALPASVMELLEPMGDALVFTAPGGGPLGYSNWRARVLAPAKRAAGIDPGFRPHDLRHTAVALAIAAGAHPKAIQMRMGHSSIQVTLDRYGHLFPDVAAALADDLDDLRHAR
jgi:integrase